MLLTNFKVILALLTACAATGLHSGRSMMRNAPGRNPAATQLRVLMGDFHEPVPEIQHPICLYQEAYEPDSCYFNSYHLPNVVPYSSVETSAGRLYWQWSKLGHICEGSRHIAKCEAHKACIWASVGCGVKYSVEQYFILTLADRGSWGYKSSVCSADGHKEALCKGLAHCNWEVSNYGASCVLNYDLIQDEKLRAVVQNVTEKGTSNIEEYATTYNEGNVDDKLRTVFNVQACFHAVDKDVCMGLTYEQGGQQKKLCGWQPWPGEDAKLYPGGSCMFGPEGYLQAYFGYDEAISKEWTLWNKKCGEFSKVADDNSTACFLAYSDWKPEKPE